MDTIYLAGGSGSRMNLQFPKQFIKLNGKPLFIYALEILRNSPDIEKIVIACNQANIKDYERALDEYGIDNTICVKGGSIRQESVYLALQHISTAEVLIHEAARPLISLEFIQQIIHAEMIDGIVPTIPIPFTVAMGAEYMEKELDRSKLHNVQLPQKFKSLTLKNAHESAIADGYTSTEDGMLVFHYGGSIRFVQGRESNIKVTTLLDLELAEKLLKL